MTRATVIIRKSGEEDLYLFTPCDGYPHGTLVDIIHMYNKDDFKLFKQGFIINNHFNIVNAVTGDSDFVYLIDYDDRKVYTYDTRWTVFSKTGLLRIDLLMENNIEIE